MSEEKEYIIPVSYTMFSTVIVKNAKNIQEALELAQKHIDDIPLPRTENAEYIDCSYRLETETDEDLETAQSYALKGVSMDVSDPNNPKFDRY